MSKTQRNCSIDCLRLLVLFFNITIHANFLGEYFPALYFDYYNAFAQFIICVFLAISGYFCAIAIFSGRKIFTKQLAAYLRCYLAWTFIYYVFALASFVAFGDESWSEFLMSRLVYFFIHGSYYHLWYFPALIYSFLLAFLIYRLFARKGLIIFSFAAGLLHIIGALGMGYYFVGNHIPVFSIMYNLESFPVLSNIIMRGIPSFFAGIVVAVLLPYFMKLSDIIAITATAAMFFLLAAEIYVLLFIVGIDTSRIKIFLMQYPLAVLFLLSALRYPMPKLERLAAAGKRSITFVLCSHAMFITIISIANERLLLNTDSIFVTSVTAAASVLAMLLCEKIDTRFTRMLRGI